MSTCGLVGHSSEIQENGSTQLWSDLRQIEGSPKLARSEVDKVLLGDKSPLYGGGLALSSKTKRAVQVQRSSPSVTRGSNSSWS